MAAPGTPVDGAEEINLAETFENVEDIMAQLVRISAAIRGASMGARFQRADESFSQERHTELRSHLEFLVQVASLAEGEKAGGNIDIVLSRNMTDIAQRLILANLIRRHRFLYARRRWTKQAAEDEAAAKPQVVVEDATLSEQNRGLWTYTVTPENGGQESKTKLSAPSVITSTVPTAIQGPVQIPQGRQLSMTVPSSTGSKATYPKPPKVGEDAMFFRCPCCFQTLPITFAKRSRWRKHLAEDIHPYTCILDDCPKPLQLYLSRKEWTQHMREEHEVSKYWLCSACLEPVRFELESHFYTHLQTQHREVVPEDQIPTLVSMSTYSTPPSLLSCPLCPSQPDDEEDDPSALLDHAAEHIHAFSLQSLPWPILEEGERQYLGLPGDNLSDDVEFFDVASGPDSADHSWSSNSPDSRLDDEMGEMSDLTFEDENPDVPWEPYRGEESEFSDSPSDEVHDDIIKDKAIRLAQALKNDLDVPFREPLINILPTLTHEQMMGLRRAYKLLVRAGRERKGVNIAKHIRVRLQNWDEDLMEACYATALGRWESEAYWANIWRHDENSRYELLIEALMGRTNGEIRLIKGAFRDKKYGNSLARCLRGELVESKFKKAVLMVLEETRMEERNQAGEPLRIDYHLVKDDVEKLNASVRSEKGGESQMIAIITQRSDSHLREVLRLYTETFSGANLAKEALKKSGNLVPSKPGDGRRRLLVSRLIRYHWDGRYMAIVQRAYRQKYGEDLRDTDLAALREEMEQGNGITSAL
ncbi:hypothetical protein CHGG_02180 [Chaetomium globosum CBS 148.51]|uniref:C2H2-type domain-containing protein n=1 Tax=Chaetomium globosum (strain ATCC 6205 / CBS 148.51 / DSM 1962 / NBRC 6347 / NRRL 1970) TaxID=306901 RepID=Q2HC74_CHAGB|nr:uncharacterized protein CHGG_02180 [Chaetomium globosum CBS 148.51]EAQ90245.1 hypothetical protein CHGG_02180 [Chaetomium globosum CBS 148.51]